MSGENTPRTKFHFDYGTDESGMVTHTKGKLTDGTAYYPILNFKNRGNRARIATIWWVGDVRIIR